MRLLCNGVALDLLSGATLSFKKVNPLFAFDNLQCERTQSFDIPATVHNERVFELAKIPAFVGNGMRRRYVAELQDGATVKRGYLHVDKYADGNYKAIFVTGELVGLQDIKNLGKIADIIQCSETVMFGQTFANTPPLPQRADDPWAIVKYVKNGSLHPSSRVMAIVDKVVEATGIRVAYPRTFGGGLRVIVGTPKGLQSTAGQISRNWMHDFVEQSAVAIYPVVNSTEVDATATDVGVLFGTDDVQVIQYRTGFDEGGQLFQYTYKGRVQHIVARQPLSLTFPNDWPATRYVGRFIADTSTIGAFQFLGDRSFVKAVGGMVTRYGEELRGREISLATGDMLTVVDESDFFNDYETGTRERPWIAGWNFGRASVRGGVTLQGGEIATGDVVRMQDNLPDVTFVELMKVVAAATGFVLNYTDADGLRFESVNVDQFEMLDITGKVVRVGDLERRFGDFVRNNIIEYSSDDSVPDAMRLRAVYEIDNDNLASEKVLQTIPFSEGRNTQYDGAAVLQVADANTKDVLGNTRTTAESMANVAIDKVAGLQRLCDASTAIDVSVRMSLSEFEALGANVAVLMDGTRYVWTEANWSKDVAALKLSAIK